MSVPWPSLANPPIVEALLDIQFSSLDQTRIADLERLQNLLPDYPNRSPRHELASQVMLSEHGQAAFAHQSSVIGFQFSSVDGAKVFQARLNGATLSFLRPYPGFAELVREGRRLWGLLSETVSPGLPTRVALRYINRLQLPLPFSDFKEYLLTEPEIAPKLPQALAGFTMRLLVPDDVTPCQAIITEVIEGQATPSLLNMIFDIDVFQSLGAGNATEASLWQVVEQLREYKNRIFFASITPKLRRLYE